MQNAGGAQAGLLDFLNFGAKSRNDPAVTLKAPFANEDAVLGELDPTGNAELAISLEQRHRPNNEITKWVQEIVPLLLTYNGQEYEQEYADRIVNFSKIGAQEYVDFLRNKNIVKTLKTGRYNVSGIIADYPVVINEGAVDGRYRWLYQVSVMVTYFDSALKGYSAGGGEDSITQEFVLTAQLGRVRGANNAHGLLIETWGVKDGS